MDIISAFGFIGDGVYAHALRQLDNDGAGIGYYGSVRAVVLCERCAPCAAKECQYGYFGGPQYFHCFYIQFLQYGLSAVLD